jgi:hypothetical protein
MATLEWPLHIGRMLHDVDEPQDLARLPPGWPRPVMSSTLTAIETTRSSLQAGGKRHA